LIVPLASAKSESLSSKNRYSQAISKHACNIHTIRLDPVFARATREDWVKVP
jgi:hypothetical protein